jgi:integrase
MWTEKLSNGKFKFCERYTDYMTGKTKKVSVTMDKNTIQTRKTALATLNQKIQAAYAMEDPKKNVTLADLVAAYTKSQELTVKKSTYAANSEMCKTLVAILGGDALVDHITARYVRERLLATRKEPGALNNLLSRFRALIRWGYVNDYIKDILFLDKIGRFPDVSHRVKIQDKYLEPEELHALLNAMHDSTWKAFTEFLVLSGLRFGEAAALEDADVDLVENVIHITKTWDHVNRIATTTKTASSTRDVFIQPELATVCRQLRALMLRRQLQNGLPRQQLFIFSRDGNPLRHSTYNIYLHRAASKSIGREITAHTLRHTHASLLLAQGVNLETISRRLGHNGSQVTKEIYLHITEQLRERDNQQLAGVSIL